MKRQTVEQHPDPSPGRLVGKLTVVARKLSAEISNLIEHIACLPASHESPLLAALTSAAVTPGHPVAEVTY